MAILQPSHRVSRLRPTAVNSVLAEVRALQSQGVNLVSLLRGEPDFPTPPHIVEAAEKALRQGRTGYPDNRGEPALRAAIAAKLERDNRLRYDPDSEILVTTGATFGIYAALAALLNEGGEVLLPEPVYDAYHSPVVLAGGRVRSVACRIKNGRFALDVAALEEAWTPQSSVLLLNTPWNPAGTVFSGAELEAIGDFVCRKNLALVCDEIYEALTYDGIQHISPASLSSELRERTVVINSLSKTYSMTGWRAGYCAAPVEIIHAMFLVLQQSSRGPATFIQDASAAALSGPQECVEQMRTVYAHRREQVCEALGGIEGCCVLVPQGGFFAMVDVSGLGISSLEIRHYLMREHGVVTMHGSAYGPSGEGTLRVSFGAGGKVLSTGLSRLREGLASFHPLRTAVP
jgi:aspartate aminotransferase